MSPDAQLRNTATGQCIELSSLIFTYNNPFYTQDFRTIFQQMLNNLSRHKKENISVSHFQKKMFMYMKKKSGASFPNARTGVGGKEEEPARATGSSSLSILSFESNLPGSLRDASVSGKSLNGKLFNLVS